MHVQLRYPRPALLMLTAAVYAITVGHGHVRADDAPLSVTAEQLLPLRSQSARFEIVEGEGKGKHIEVKVRRDGERYWRIDHGPLKNRRVRRDADGDVLMPRSDVSGEDSTLLFSPETRLLPARLVKGKAARSTGRVRITNLRGDDEKASGDYVRVVELLGERRVETPAGTFDTMRVRAEELFKLGLAKVHVVTTSDYAPDVGIVRQRVEKKVTKLALFTSTESYTILLDKAWEAVTE